MRQGFVLGQPMACDFGSQNFLDFLNSSIINTKTVTMRGARGDLPPKFPYYRSLLKFYLASLHQRNNFLIFFFFDGIRKIFLES